MMSLPSVPCLMCGRRFGRNAKPYPAFDAESYRHVGWVHTICALSDQRLLNRGVQTGPRRDVSRASQFLAWLRAHDSGFGDYPAVLAIDAGDPTGPLRMNPEAIRAAVDDYRELVRRVEAEVPSL